MAYINVVIPTRERAHTLYWTLKTCLLQDHPDYKVWVCDNCSTDSTEEVVNSFNDKRVVYLKTSQRLSMSHNWEFALSHLKSGFALVIGDDDGLIPNAISDLSALIDETGALAVRPPNITYYWPNCVNSDVQGMLYNLPLRGTSKWINTNDILKATAETVEYHHPFFLDLPTVYHGCVSVEIIKRITRRDSGFIHGCAPDMYSAVIVAAEIENYLLSSRPVCINGLSAHSTGVSSNLIHVDDSSIKRFFAENPIPFHPTIVPKGVQVRTIISRQLVVADAFQWARERNPRVPAVNFIHVIRESLKSASGLKYKEQFCLAIEEIRRLARIHNLSEYAENLIEQTHFDQTQTKSRIHREKFNCDPNTYICSVDTNQFKCNNVYETSLLISEIINKSANSGTLQLVGPAQEMGPFLNPQLTPEYFDLYLVRTSILAALKGILPNLKGKVLDIGCGEMPYKPLILSNPMITGYIGLDFDSGRYAQRKRPDIFWNEKRIPLGNDSIDCAIATEVFEHVPNLPEMLVEVLRVIKPGGILFFTVPFLWPLHDVPHDECRYTPFALERILKAAGFYSIQLRPLGGWNASLAQMLGLWIRRAPLPENERRNFAEQLFPFYKSLIESDLLPNSFSESSMITGIAGTANKPTETRCS